MSFDGYFAAQQGNLGQIRELPHFKVLIRHVDGLYERSIDALAPDKTQPLYARLLLLCHKSFMSAAATIGRGQPDDAAGVTRRAIEASCLPRDFGRWLFLYF